jgi:ethanolamine ammonia-lyase large subunit
MRLRLHAIFLLNIDHIQKSVKIAGVRRWINTCMSTRKVAYKNYLEMLIHLLDSTSCNTLNQLPNGEKSGEKYQL